MHLVKEPGSMRAKLTCGSLPNAETYRNCHNMLWKEEMGTPFILLYSWLTITSNNKKRDSRDSRDSLTYEALQLLLMPLMLTSLLSPSFSLLAVNFQESTTSYYHHHQHIS
jgi:hypothetical protein